MPEMVDFVDVLKTIKVDLVSSTRRVSGELGISQAIVVGYLDEKKTSGTVEIYLKLRKYCRTFVSPNHFL